MRLFELINEQDFPEIKTTVKKSGAVPDLYHYNADDSYWDDDDDGPDGTPRPHEKTPDIEHLGTGAFASTYRHKDTPHDVTKVSKATTKPDGWQALFTALSKNKEMHSNPYFPRFRSIRRFKHEQGPHESYIVKVESLEPYKGLSVDERKMLLRKIFDEHGYDVIRHYFEQTMYGRGTEEPWDQFVFAWAIRNCLEGDTWQDELRWTIEDQHFKEAIEFLQKVAKDADYEMDLHMDNMMVRRTSVGPQLVLNDPLGFSSKKDEEDWDEYS